VKALLGVVSEDKLDDVDRIALEAATRSRRFAQEDLRQVIEHVAQAGFPSTPGRATGFAGLEWAGRVLRGSDRITAAERHYLRHVVKGREWPSNFTLNDYLQSISEVVHDQDSGVFTSRYQGAWQVGFIRRSGNLQGPLGAEWVIVEYRMDIGYWTTAYQPKEGLSVLQHPNREYLIWHREPK